MGFLGMEKCAILKVAVFDEKRLDLVAGCQRGAAEHCQLRHWPRAAESCLVRSRSCWLQSTSLIVTVSFRGKPIKKPACISLVCWDIFSIWILWIFRTTTWPWWRMPHASPGLKWKWDLFVLDLCPASWNSGCGFWMQQLLSRNLWPAWKVKVRLKLLQQPPSLGRVVIQ